MLFTNKSFLPHDGGEERTMCNREMSSLANCPYCDELVGAEAVQYGTERMHPECYEATGVINGCSWFATLWYGGGLSSSFLTRR